MTVMTDEREPLLAATSLEASDSRDEKPAVSPIPWGPISILLLLNALGPLAYELIFPFISAQKAWRLSARSLMPIPRPNAR